MFLSCQFHVCCQTKLTYLIALSASGLLLASVRQEYVSGNSRGAADLSNRALELSAIPHSDVLVVTTSEQAVLLPWTAGDAAYSSHVTLPEADVQQYLSRGHNVKCIQSERFK